MFKTVRAKVIITAIAMLAFLMLVFGCYAIISRMKTKQLMVQNYAYSINSFVEDINDRTIKSEDNLKGLALIGGLFYRTDRSYELTDRVITRIFENYPETLGGGIWFIPYIVDKSKKYVCFYAYRDKNNNVIIDKNFSSKEYDYPNQEWYKQIISQVTPKRNIVLTKPYYENLGSYTKMVTVGTGIYVDNELVGIVTVDMEINSIMDEVSKMKPLEKTLSMYKSGEEIKNSFALLGNPKEDYIIATNDPYLDGEKLVGHSLKEIPWYADNLYSITYITYHGKKYVPFVKKLSNGMELVICIPKSEMFKDIDRFYSYIVLVMLLIGLIAPILLYYSMKYYIVNPIDKLINIANKIGKGEDIEIKIEKPEEFVQLASTFDKMTKDLKSITLERAKINSELSIAKSIQTASLPNVFPPFPKRTEFDIYASMDAAKEVGGDFYDFFFINENEFMFLIADVSGKGVPAALFMMTVKTLINNIAQIVLNPKELIKKINNKVCEINKQGFFVTMLACIVNINSGKMSIINCGHNPPLLKKKGGNYEFLKLTSNFPIGIFDDAEFEISEITMSPGDLIYTYTDGVTEATRVDNEVYGEERLYDCLNNIEEETPDIIMQKVKTSIQQYTESAPQSDDITMLTFKYLGQQNNIKTFKQEAKIENYKAFYTWIHETCKEWNINTNITNKLDMCAEEIFANITFYAYPEKTGMIEAELKNSDGNIILVFKDDGIKYNPLERPDPNINLPPEQRPLGGLGIFMTKKMTDNIFYQRENNKNILTLIFKY